MNTLISRTLIVLAGWAVCAGALNAQRAPEVKREFRAVWISTISNLDYPSRPTPERVALKEEYKNLLDQYKVLGFNAVIVQIRPAADAFYPSALAPWSKYLTGIQGRPPVPEDFDPLQMMIEETHQRGMEFHAWLNPYRATTDLDTLSLAPNHAFKQHRNWMMRYGNRFYFNPAMPEVRQYLSDVVAEVVEHYDVDAIHFDDYFYPYPEKGWTLQDSLDYKFYGVGFRNKEDWRRNNIDLLIESVSARIKSIKPYVKFGISPFGVWRNKTKDPQWGSDTKAGITCYDDIYADVLKWMRNGWIDYVAPQIYWNIGYAPADYATLVRWWSSQAGDCQLYIGHAAYKVANNPEIAWSQPTEIPRQIVMTRLTPHCLGSAYFRSKSVLFNPLSLKDSLRYYYRYPALQPEHPAMELPVAHAPKLKTIWPKKGKVKLTWKPDPLDKELPPYYYVVYRFPGASIGNFDDPSNILAVTSLGEKSKKYNYLDTTAEPGKFYTYCVLGANRQNSESRPGKPRVILKKEKGLRWARVAAPAQGKRP